jgi:hypothetical protein
MTNKQNLIDSLYQSLGYAIEEIDAAPSPTPSDGITLITGSHTLSIETQEPPKQVFVSLVDQDSQVCGSDLSTVSVTTNPTGFVAYVVVKSNEATLNWVITYA